MAGGNFKTCFVGCKRNGVTYHAFPKNPAIRSLWFARIPPMYEYSKSGKNIKKRTIPKDPRLCSEHFVPSDYKQGHVDSNKRRKIESTQMIRKKLRDDAVPSVWPGATHKIDPDAPPDEREASFSLPSLRAEREEQIAKEKDEIRNLDDLKSLPFDNPVNIIFSGSIASFVKINTGVSPPRIDYCVRIKESLEYEIFVQNKCVPPGQVLGDKDAPSKVNSFSFLETLLNSLENFDCVVDLGEKIERISKEIEELKFDEKKQGFLSEQLKLLSKTPHQRRYSQDLLAMACMWRSVSPALYNQIRSDGIIQLPSDRYIRQLSSAITADFTLSDGTVAYLDARMKKLEKKDHAINLILDEVFVVKDNQYTGGVFYGNENNSTTKTLLCLMIKSVAGGYRDVVAMTPIDEISAEKIHKVWEDAVKKLTKMGFNVVATTSDNHKSNMKHFKKILCGGNLQPYITNPFDSSKKIFLLFDPTHILKCITNNFRQKESFACPAYPEVVDRFEDSHPKANFYPSYGNVKDLQELEIGKPLKIAHKLSDKVINPLALEKTNVSLADALFDESTINGLLFYGNNGFPEFIQTAKFLRVIRNWWDTFNVKSKFKGKHKRNKFMEAIDETNVEEVSAYLQKFTDWVKEWKEEYPDFGLTSPTFQALIQTVTATKELCTYILEHVDDVEYILLGFLQQDYLEGRFGWYRQLAGGNYYCSVVQFLQAEKTIRLRNLVKSGYEMREIKEIFKVCTEACNAAIEAEASVITELLNNFSFYQPAQDVQITYYIAGYLARRIVKSSKCESCHFIVSDGMQSLTVDIDIGGMVDSADVLAGKAFVDAISRGGLTKPSQLTYITSMHASHVWRFISKDSNLMKLLLNSTNSRALFVEVFLQQLEDDSNTNGMLEVECENGHSFKEYVRTIGYSMFNMFAKNYCQECKDEIHAARKRSNVDEDESKRDPCKMKEKKLKS